MPATMSLWKFWCSCSYFER